MEYQGALGTSKLTATTDREKRTFPGMANWAGEGPAGAQCGGCKFRCYVRETKDRTNAYYYSGCRKFLILTGRHGPIIGAWYLACRYFEAKPLRRKRNTVAKKAQAA